MEKRYLYLLRRWLWLIVLATVVASTAAFLAVKDQPPTYEARARLLVGPGTDAPNPDLNALRTGGQLMQTYAELVATAPFLQSIITKLELNIRSAELNRMIDVKSNQDTQILIITVQHKDPLLAIDIANAAAEALVNLSPSANDSPTTLLNEQMRRQAERLERIIANSDAAIEKLEADLRALTEQESQGLIVLQTDNYLQKQGLMIQQLSQERGRLSDALSALTTLYDSLQVTPTNQVKIVEPAVVSEVVVSQIRLTVLIAGGAGLILALTIALGYEFFNAHIMTASELASVSGLPLLGTISKYRFVPPIEGNSLLVLPESAAAEDFRMLGTKLVSKIKPKSESEDLISGAPMPMLPEAQKLDRKQIFRSVMVCSSQIKDDNREFVANLAIVLEQVGLRVILVDADLDSSKISRLFKLGQKRGLVDCLTGSCKDAESFLEPFSTNLSILPSGQLRNQDESHESFELLASTKMRQLIGILEKEADVVLLAVPPLLSSAGSLILASSIDGVILVAREGRSRREEINEVVDSLEALNIPIIGAVFDHNYSSQSTVLDEQTASEKVVSRISPFLARVNKVFRNAILKRAPSLPSNLPEPRFGKPNEAGVSEGARPRFESDLGSGLKNEVFPIQASKR